MLQQQRTRQFWLQRLLLAGVDAYLLGLLAWAGLSRLLGDRWWWLFLLNVFALYLFVPALLLPLLGLLVRRRRIWASLIVIFALFMTLYGSLWVTRRPANPPGPAIRVMTFNVLGFNQRPEQIIASIRTANPDLVTLQELSPLVAAALQRDLRSDYPYQFLDPHDGVTGLGVISRFSLRDTGQTLPGEWVGRPQLLQLAFADTTVTIIHAHTSPSLLGRPATMERRIRLREEQARTIVAFAASQPGPVLAPSDYNLPDQSRAYRILTGQFGDAWRSAGTGFGHTFPGADFATSPGSSRPTLFGRPVPQWLIRIDYIFYSRHFTAINAQTGPWDGSSDHRPVVATLVLTAR